ncbi:hypothetical protein [Methylopila sp. M107]|uniref:hypothetical protein n=1 Tax=Methylopila sp. M107 TaxID=1101190 RepID=UPI000376360A|nr:hypothetical protein [Methylopila sp. M107]
MTQVTDKTGTPEQLHDDLWGMYQENVSQSRHHEDQRSSVAGTLLTIAGAVVSLITFKNKIGPFDLPLTILMTAIGIFGMMFSYKQYERSCLHLERARQYRDAVDAFFEGGPVKTIKLAADAKNAEAFPRFSKLRLNVFWMSLYGLIALLGVILTGVAIFWPVTAA